MAEDEEIIIIENIDKTTEENNKIKKNSSNKKKFNRKTIIIIATISIVTILIVALTVIILMRSKTLQKNLPFTKKEIVRKKTVLKITPSKIEKMIVKANYLYNHNNKQEALNLYEKISIFNEALSRYNLGVAQLKNKHYNQALITFHQAILNHEKVCMSAINAAVCALHLHEHAKFNYFINLAYAYLPYEINTPLYSYYYAIIKYYKGDYLESLSALKHPNSEDYYSQKQFLKSKINSLFGNYNNAIKNFINPYSQKNALSIGLLYANMGDYSLARKYLQVNINKTNNTLRRHLALALINLKDYQYHDTSKELKYVASKYPKVIYPITVYLKNIFTDPILAQKYYRHILNHSISINYAEIFHFAPYKIFNANNTIKDIRRGNINIYTNDIKNATKYLKKSKVLSAINIEIIKAIKQAIYFKISTANQILSNIQKRYPKDSVLQYDLALTYAQLGDIKQANKHFTTSYYLDSKNYLSGIFAMMSAKLLHNNNTQFNTILRNNLANAINHKNTLLYSILIDIVNNNLLGELHIVNQLQNNKSLNLAIKIMVLNQLNKQKSALKSAKQLSLKLPHDILSQLIYINEKLKDKSNIKYARDTLFFMQHHTLNFNSLYYGSAVTRYLYIYQALFTGTLFPLQQQLQIKLQSTPVKQLKNVLYASALTNLFAKKYELSYMLFNQLIDQYKIHDAKTLFLGALASIKANHHANATILLELAILNNPNNSASHYALGLLYLEKQNNLGAAIQFKQIRPSFQPSYFDFYIDIHKLDLQFRDISKNSI